MKTIDKKFIEKLCKKNFIRKSSGNVFEYEAGKKEIQKYNFESADYEKDIKLLCDFIKI